MKTFNKLFDNVCSPENLFSAWDEFKRDKGKKEDVLEFERNLEQNVFELYREIRDKTYKHLPYMGFHIYDPKRRHIHKASVRDRVLHHAVFKILNPIFEPTFIPTSFSCRVGKGTHKGVATLNAMIRKVSRNYTRPCYALKCDVRKFFDSVDHTILLSILERKIRDPEMMELLREIVGSFSSGQSDLFSHRGVPIGNLTSQIFANVYMNEFDQFVKRELKVACYVRYTDDFVVLSHDESELEPILRKMEGFLQERLQLSLHPEKVIIRKPNQGVDFLGYVIFPHHILLRTRTKRRMIRKLKEKTVMFKEGQISEETLDASLRSYLGVMSHADAHRLSEEVKNSCWFWRAG
jgi:retron-type reverse transcriptase